VAGKWWILRDGGAGEPGEAAEGHGAQENFFLHAPATTTNGAKITPVSPISRCPRAFHRVVRARRPAARPAAWPGRASRLAGPGQPALGRAWPAARPAAFHEVAGRFFGVAAGRPPGLRPAGRLVGRSAARPAAVRPPSRRPARLESRSAPVPMSTAANVGHHGGPVGPLDRTWRKSSKCWSAQVLLRCTPAPRRWHAPPPPRPWLRVSALCVRACLHVPVPRALARAFEGNGVQCVQRACVQYASRAFNACKCVAGSPAGSHAAGHPATLAGRPAERRPHTSGTAPI